MATGYSVRHKGDTKDILQSTNPIIPIRELVIETDTKKLKIGNGSSPYNSLPYVQSNGYTLGGTRYLFVRGSPSLTDEFYAAYSQALTMTPTASSPVTIVIAPGKINLSQTLYLGTSYINIVSLTGNPDVIISGLIQVSADVYLCGLDNSSTVNTFAIQTGSSFTIKNCIGGDYAFQGYQVSGTFINCKAGTDSFTGSQTAGTFINCTGGYRSFGGYYSDASGTFIDCVGGNYSFGGYSGTASGIFIRCTGGNYSFSMALGIFEYCVGGAYSFDNPTSTCKIFYCRKTVGTFTPPPSGGQIKLCIDGNNNVYSN